jgi:tetraacyldisaccharide 4'-kinase
VAGGRLERLWYGRHPARWGLAPLAGAFCGVTMLRRRLLRAGRDRRRRFAVPVVVVGNLTVGGTGKTPLVIALVEALRARGWHPGVVSRGHGGRRHEDPLTVDAATPPAAAGDEPVLVAWRTGCPVVVGRDRAAAVRLLLQRSPQCDVVVADDGMQHYRMYRDLEIAVVDARRGFGNGWCLPAGPLREPRARLRDVDRVVLNGEGVLPGFRVDARMRLEPGTPYNLTRPELRRSLDAFSEAPVAAVAGIGDPERFFAALREAGLEVDARAFADHHPFRPRDLAFAGRRALLMTEKDAVKIRAFARRNHWVVPVRARLDEGFHEDLSRRLKRLRRAAEEGG